MPTSARPSSLRTRLGIAGTVAVLVAIALSALIDRALVLAGLWPPLRYLAATGTVVAVLVLPLLWSLEVWVLRPVEALRALHRKAEAGETPSLPRETTDGLPEEMRVALEQQVAMLEALHSTNRRLANEVGRRTAVLEALLAGSDAVLTAPDAELGRGLVEALRNIAGDAHPAVILPALDGAGYTLHLAPAGELSGPDRARLEAELREELGRDRALAVDWHPAPRRSHEPIKRLRVLLRVPLGDGAQMPALLLLTNQPPGFQVAVAELRSTLATLGQQILHRLDQGPAGYSSASMTRLTSQSRSRGR